MKRKVACGVILFCLGYAVAVVSFRQELWIGAATGKLVTVTSVFPFQQTSKARDRAFEVYFPCSLKPRNDEQLLVSSRSFLNFSGREAYTSGEMLLSAERDIIAADVENGFSAATRKRISDVFYNLLANDGVLSARQYATEIRRTPPQDEATSEPSR